MSNKKLKNELEKKVINGVKIAEKIKDKIVREIVKLPSRPNLAIILIGDRKDSELYVSMKEKEAKKVGIDTHLYKCEEGIDEGQVLEMIECLNNDKEIDGILVQLPLPKKFDTDKIVGSINRNKDVDCFHPENLKVLKTACKNTKILPPVFGATLSMLKSIKMDIENKEVVVIANSDIFGNNFSNMFKCLGAHADMIKINDKNLNKKTQKADILISAVGKKHFIKKDMIKDGVVLIDVGIIKEDKKIYGDVDAEDVFKKAAFFSPVPGGVGPLTIAMLFKNTLELYKIHRSI